MQIKFKKISIHSFCVIHFIERVKKKIKYNFIQFFLFFILEIHSTEKKIKWCGFTKIFILFALSLA